MGSWLGARHSVALMACVIHEEAPLEWRAPSNDMISGSADLQVRIFVVDTMT